MILQKDHLNYGKDFLSCLNYCYAEFGCDTVFCLTDIKSVVEMNHYYSNKDRNIQNIMFPRTSTTTLIQRKLKQITLIVYFPFFTSSFEKCNHDKSGLVPGTERMDNRKNHHYNNLPLLMTVVLHYLKIHVAVIITLK